jgi:hypothetical protein
MMGCGSFVDRRFFKACQQLLLVAACFAVGCGENIKPSKETADEPGVVSEVTNNGPVSLLLTVTPDKPALSDTIELTVEITRDEKFKIGSPELADLFDDFLIADFKELLPRIDGDRIVVEHKYKLEPLTPGKVRVNAIPYRFSVNDTDEPLVVATKPVTLDVHTIVSSTSPSLIEPMELPPNPFRHVPLIAGSLIAIAFGAFLLRRRLKRVKLEPVLSPVQLAQRDLGELRTSGIAQTEPKTFYVRLTGIVCRFVEATTRVRAPKQTTGEFLREIEQRGVFSDEKQSKFRGFLEAADLVKYAGQQPTENDIESSLQTADAFVSEAEVSSVAAPLEVSS